MFLCLNLYQFYNLLIFFYLELKKKKFPSKFFKTKYKKLVQDLYYI